MIWIIGVLTFVLVVDCLLLTLLVLIQLPKKEAGLGTAFGGSATDALFGAGTGNVLTQLTKYATGTFFVVTCCLYMLNMHQAQAKRSTFEKNLSEVSSPSLEAATPPEARTNAVVPAAPPLIATNPVIPAPPGTTPPAPPESAPPAAQPDASATTPPNATPPDTTPPAPGSTPAPIPPPPN